MGEKLLERFGNLFKYFHNEFHGKLKIDVSLLNSHLEKIRLCMMMIFLPSLCLINCDFALTQLMQIYVFNINCLVLYFEFLQVFVKIICSDYVTLNLLCVFTIFRNGNLIQLGF